MKKLLLLIALLTINIATSQTVTDRIQNIRNTQADVTSPGLVTVALNPTSGHPYVNSVAKTLLEWNISQVKYLQDSLNVKALKTEIPNVYPWALNANKPSYNWSEIGSKPTFSTVATSGSYNDLINKPSIPKIITLSGTTSGGSVTFNVSGAGFSSLNISGCNFKVNDNSKIYEYQVTAISNTSVTVSVKEQSFTGISVAGINVLGSVTMNNVANGTTVYAQFVGN